MQQWPVLSSLFRRIHFGQLFRPNRGLYYLPVLSFAGSALHVSRRECAASLHCGALSTPDGSHANVVVVHAVVFFIHYTCEGILK